MRTIHYVSMEHSISSPDNLAQLIEYDPQTGVMIWRARSARFFSESKKRSVDHAAANWNSRYAGTPALASVGNHGYMRGNIGNKSFLAHRVAMAITLKTWGFGFVDHINGDKLDNRRANLRLCTNAENSRNGKSRGGSSQYKGVCLQKQNKNWIATIMKDGKSKHIGCFDDELSAAKAYDNAAISMHGAFARLNFPHDHG